MHNRRQALLALGGGAVALAGLSTGAAVLFKPDHADAGDSDSPKSAGSFSDRDASYVSAVGDLNNLGAAGLAATPSAAAAAAMRATPRFPTPLVRDPVLHLLRRATFGPTDADIALVKRMGIDAWLDQQLTPASLADPIVDEALKVTPTVGMTTAQIRATVQDGDYKPMEQLAEAVITRQVWTTRQLYEVMVDFWNNHLNITSPFDGGWDVRNPSDTNVIQSFDETPANMLNLVVRRA